MTPEETARLEQARADADELCALMNRLLDRWGATGIHYAASDTYDAMTEILIGRTLPWAIFLPHEESEFPWKIVRQAPQSDSSPWVVVRTGS